jgi:hypothetical protein
MGQGNYMGSFGNMGYNNAFNTGSGNKFDKQNQYNNFFNNPFQQFDYYNQIAQYNQFEFNDMNSTLVGCDSEYLILSTLQHYFSLKNLNKDIFMRQHMNEDGYIKVSDINNFQK